MIGFPAVGLAFQTIVTDEASAGFGGSHGYNYSEGLLTKIFVGIRPLKDLAITRISVQKTKFVWFKKIVGEVLKLTGDNLKVVWAEFSTLS